MHKGLAKQICELGVTPACLGGRQVGLRPPSVTPSNTLTVLIIF